MSDAELFFTEGFKHITDLKGYDHILFISALTVKYLLKDWKKLLWLVTAFTIGHSITLALSSLNMISFSRDMTEFLIAVTILITALINIFSLKPGTGSFQNPRWIYFVTAFFGLIHGLGFSSYLKSLFGTDENILVPLLFFNLGLEAGQLLIVLVLLSISFIFVTTLKMKHLTWIRIVSAFVILFSVKMCIERFPYKSKNHNEETAHSFHDVHHHQLFVCTEHSKQSRVKPWKQV